LQMNVLAGKALHRVLAEGRRSLYSPFRWCDCSCGMLFCHFESSLSCHWKRTFFCHGNALSFVIPKARSAEEPVVCLPCGPCNGSRCRRCVLLDFPGFCAISRNAGPHESRTTSCKQVP